MILFYKNINYFTLKMCIKLGRVFFFFSVAINADLTDTIGYMFNIKPLLMIFTIEMY